MKAERDRLRGTVKQASQVAPGDTVSGPCSTSGRPVRGVVVRLVERPGGRGNLVVVRGPEYEALGEKRFQFSTIRLEKAVRVLDTASEPGAE